MPASKSALSRYSRNEWNPPCRWVAAMEVLRVSPLQVNQRLGSWPLSPLRQRGHAWRIIGLDSILEVFAGDVRYTQGGDASGAVTIARVFGGSRSCIGYRARPKHFFTWPAVSLRRCRSQQLPTPSNRPRLNPVGRLPQAGIVGLLGVGGQRLGLVGPTLALVNLRALSKRGLAAA